MTETEAAHELTTRGPAAGQRLGPTARRGTRAWLAATLAIALGLLGVLCVDHGRRTLSVTFDEPNHVAAGLEWWQHGLAAAGMGALVTTQAAIALAARDVELGYVNALAARDPAAVVLDSDLDWGQDLFALRDETRARHIRRLSIAYFGMTRACEQGLPPLVPLVPGRPATGWIAISEQFYRQRNYFGLLSDPCDLDSWYDPDVVPPEPFAWLRAHEPIAIAGSSIRLYYIPPAAKR